VKFTGDLDAPVDALDLMVNETNLIAELPGTQRSRPGGLSEPGVEACAGDAQRRAQRTDAERPAMKSNELELHRCSFGK
jgi:hypothetical protein